MSGARCCALLVLLIGSLSMSKPVQGKLPDLAIDGRNSGARFVVHMRLGARIEGKLTRVSGVLRGTPSEGWQVLVKVDGRSLKVDGPQWRERITRSDSFLAVDRFPVIRFESVRFSDALLHGGGPLSGELTLRGLTRPVSFQLLASACVQPGRDCDIQVQGTISRHEFAMTAYRALVRDEVDFHFRVRLQPLASGQ
jgi:polyisoprenoid-binding protein YceI